MKERKANQLIEKLLAYGEKHELLAEWDKVAARNKVRDILDTKIMGALTPRQSEIAERFYNTAEEIDIKTAASH